MTIDTYFPSLPVKRKLNHDFLEEQLQAKKDHIKSMKTRLCAGRPLGSTKRKKSDIAKKIAKAKYHIVCRYKWEKDNGGLNKLSKRELFNVICESISCQYNLPSTFSFPYKTATARLGRSGLDGSGNKSPLLPVENEFVSLILCMSKIKRALTVSEGLRLINELIDGTEIQQQLIAWKIKRKIYCHNEIDLGRVGTSYWRGFLNRNSSQIKSKVARKFAFDRSNWTTYLNFRDMYLHIKDVMINDSKIAEKLPEPIWVDRYGKKLPSEEGASGCKTDLKITRPDMVIMFDEVGCDLSQEGDHIKGGEKYMCSPDEVPYKSSASKNCHFTTLGLTRLDGEPLMCVTIIAGKKREVTVETGIDWSKLISINDDDIKDMDEYSFLKSHFGEGKLLPGGPTCNFNGVDVPAFVTFSESGGINSDILCEIFKRIDNLELYKKDREKGYIPFCLLDGHNSRFDIDFLKYINDPKTKWNVCIGVPYSTSLWQVGDSSQQNGTYKMTISDEKKNLFDVRLSDFQQDMHLIRSDIMVLVTKAFIKGFMNVENNKKAISDRGWYPYTMNLLLDPILRATMTEEMIQWEISSGLFPSSVTESSRSLFYDEDKKGNISLTSKVKINYSDTSHNLNFSKGPLAAYVCDTIVSEVDRQTARERLQKCKEEGETKRERIMKIQKKLTAGKLVLDGRSYHLDRTVLEQVERRHKAIEKTQKDKKNKEILDFMITCYKADKLVQKYKDMDIVDWKRKDEILTFLKPLRVEGDEPFPKTRKEVERRFNEWKDRPRRLVELNDIVKKKFDDWKIQHESVDDTNVDEDGS